MKILLDQGLPRSCSAILCNAGIDAIHTGDCGLATAADSKILEFSRRQNRIIVTLDADFHVLMALSGSIKPSVIRIRIEGLRGKRTAELIQEVVARCEPDLNAGAVVSVQPDRIRVHRLPVGPQSRKD